MFLHFYMFDNIENYWIHSLMRLFPESSKNVAQNISGIKKKFEMGR
jgi:hypothetical protein